MFKLGSANWVSAVLSVPGRNYRPIDLFTDWNITESTISLPVSSLTDLTDAKANPTSGDGRQVLLSICKTVFEWYNDLRIAGTDPSAVVVTRTPRTSLSAGNYTGKPREKFSMEFYEDFPEGTVTDESES